MAVADEAPCSRLGYGVWSTPRICSFSSFHSVKDCFYSVCAEQNPFQQFLRTEFITAVSIFFCAENGLKMESPDPLMGNKVTLRRQMDKWSVKCNPLALYMISIHIYIYEYPGNLINLDIMICCIIILLIILFAWWHIYIYVCVCMYMYIYIYNTCIMCIYIYINWWPTKKDFKLPMEGLPHAKNRKPICTRRTSPIQMISRTKRATNMT